ncbi:MAG: 30S ribosomal protein S6 [Actinobacteria bacterium]|uniref:30S ribosomal protein S6 n=1 Tax=marine sediment metagenome TaxID=412755 RepID=X0Z371_9ZZZZ|nr:30S ribosomal protein S6 [Actinomycetota bacterium]
MRRYEMMMITDSTLGEKEQEDLVSKVKDIISKYDAELYSIDKWGEKKLAYSIKGYDIGTYYVLFFSGSNELIEELKRVLKITEGIIRFRIFRREDLEKVE